VWNDCLRDRKEAHAAGLPYVTSAELSRLRITQAKRTEERTWLADVSAVVLQQSLRDLDTAYKNFFDSLKGKRKGRKVGPPRFKSKKDTRQSIRLTTNAFSLRNDGTVYVAKVGNLKVRWSRRLPAAPTSLTVTRDSSGRYFLSFVVDSEPDILPEAEADTGVDLGLSAFAVLSDGRKIDSPRFLRRDWHHKASTQIIRDNQAVFVEDLAVSGLGRTRLAKSVHDAGWSAFVGMLEYKAVKHGRTFAKVDRAFPSSQICSACGFRDGPKPLNIRQWACGACGTVHDRDHNAARNVLFEGRRIVAAGRAETLNAGGAPVRRAHVPAQRGEAGSSRKGQPTQAGIPGLQAREHVNR
jgi:putative transposase